MTDHARDLIRRARNQYEAANYAGSLETLAEVKAVYRDAFAPLPEHFDATIKEVRKEWDQQKLALVKW